ncbi:class I SAM-dependent methyltransferase [Neotabrizicola sp. sgz301269]|uniref:class I SAM-dependent methyltransferase n=1 Tax=Neotabrizicola sp. sgz301269 TaxID=3276282 RepID=UPI00376F7697
MDQDLSRRLKDFLNGPFPQIEGWCNPYIFQLLQPIAEFQRSIGLAAPICEIGVFKGKFFNALVKTSPLREGHHAIDVFDLQEFNLDYAGAGNLKAFKDNIILSGEDPEKMVFIERDSTTFRRRDLDVIRDRVGGFSIFSVDGCHLAEHTINDIRIAMDLTADAGVIFVDDYFNPSWPGVHEGVCKLFHTDAPLYVPLAYSANKLALCHIGYHRRYLNYLSDFIGQRYSGVQIKKVSQFGYESLVLLPGQSGGGNTIIA